MNQPLSHRTRILLILFLTGFICNISFSQSLQLSKEEQTFIANNPEIKLGGEPDWEPMIIIEKGKIIGYNRDILDEIEKLTGLRFIIIVDSWSTIVEKGKSRDIDGLLYSSPLPDRKPYFSFTDPYIEFQASFYGELNDPFVLSMDKLAGAKVAVQKGDLFSNTYIDSLKSFEKVEIEDRIDIVKAIISGEVDYYFGAMDMTYYLARHGITSIKPVYLAPDISFKAVISIRKDYPELVSIINKSLAAIPRERINAIHSKWNFESQTGIILDRKFIYNLIAVIIGFLLIIALWIVTIFKQIEQKKKVREQLIKEKAQLVSQIENSSALIYSLDQDLNVLVRNYNFNSFIKTISGRPIKVGDNLKDFLPEKYKQKWIDRYQKGLNGDKYSIEDNTSITGTRKNFITYINPIRVDGKVIGISCITEDMTQYTSLNRYMLQLMQTSHDFIFIKDREFRYKIASQSFAELNGYSSWKDLIDKTDDDLDPENSDLYKETEHRVINEGIYSLNKLHTFKDRNGKERWVQSSNEPIFDDDGNIIGLSGISRDITEEKLVEQEQRILIATIENSRDFVCLFDESYKFLYINDHGKKIIGADDIKSITLANLLSESNMKLVRFNLDTKVKAGETWNTELPMINQKSRETLSLDHSIIRIVDENGKFICFGDVARDVSERNLLSQQLIDLSVKQQLMKSTLHAEENERNRIAKELHDGLQQKLALAVISLQGNKNNSPEQTISLLNEGINDLREMSHSLSPISLQRNGLAATLQDEVNRLDRLSETSFSYYQNVNDHRFEEEVEINLYRIFQECISNSLKYAKAQEVHVQLILSHEIVTLTVEDDGVGFDPNLSTTDGFGLNSIRNRANLLNGHLEITSSPGNGTSILIEIEI